MDEELINWILSLPPDQQQQVMQQLGLADANAMPIGFDGAYSPALDDQSYALNAFGSYPSDYNSKGEPLPFGLDQQGQVLTQQKNRNALLADQVTGALAGPGAYDPNAFTPSYEFSGPTVQTPGRQMASYYASMGGGGFQSMIADAILNGDDPSTAVSKAIALASLPDSESLTPEMRAQRDALVMSMQPARVSGGTQVPSSGGDLTDAQKFAQQYDVGALYDFANELGSKIAADPAGASGYTDPATGTVYQNAPEEVWSGAAEKYRDLGLPFPTATYMDEQYGAPLADQGRLDALGQADQAATAAAGSARADQTKGTEMEQMLKLYSDEIALRNRPVAGQQRMIDGQRTTTLGPVGRGNDGSLVPVRTGGDSFRPLAGKQSVTAPSYWQGLDEMQYGDPAAGVKEALLNLDFTGAGNAAAASLGGTGEQYGALDADTVKRQKAKTSASQEAARKAMSKRIDLNQRGTAERDAASQLGVQLALNAQGRTPLKDAMMQRLLANRAQGVY